MSQNSPKVAGYRLHKNRILFSGGEIVRTIKFPLVLNNNTPNAHQVLEEFKNKVIADDRVIRGDVNLNDYLDYSHKNNKIYTLFDFWLDSLKAGVIWFDNAAKLATYKEGSDNIKEKIWKNAKKEIRELFDKDLLFNSFISKAEVRKTSSPNSFKRKLVSCLQQSQENKKAADIREKEKAADIIEKITNRFFDANGNLVLDRKQQDKVWLEEMGLDKSLISKAKPQGDFRDITFLIIPELQSFSEENVEKLITTRRQWLEKNGREWLENKKKSDSDNKSVDNQILSILGLDSNFNGYSNYFNIVIKSLKDGRLEELAEALSVYLGGMKVDILKSLKFLSDKAKILPDVSMPISSWADYRSVFGGKIQSWFSNFIKRQAELGDKIKQFKSDLQKARDYLSSLTLEEVKDDVKDLRELIDRLLLVKNEDITKEKEFEIFDSLLSSLKRRLNFFYQQYLYDEAKEGDNVKKHKILGPIFKNIEKPIAFYGEAQRKKNKKFVENTISILEEGIVFLTDLINNLQNSFSPKQTFVDVKKNKETEEVVYRKELQFFWNKLKDLAINSKEFQKECQNIIKEAAHQSVLPELEELFVNQNKNYYKYTKYTFHKSEYAKGNVEEIKLKEFQEDYLTRFEQLIKHLTGFLMQYDKNKLLQDRNLLLDWVELAKKIVSDLIRFNSNKEFQLQKIKDLVQFEKAKNYCELFRLDKVSKDEYSFIIQSLILSEIKGAATLFSKQKYIASYSVQVIASNDKFKLFYLPLDKTIDILSTDKKELMKKHRYLIAFDEIKKANKKSTENKIDLLRLDKNETSLFSTTEEEILNKTLTINSSFYQLQFLDKYLYRPKGWEDIDITLNEWSFIVEEAYNIRWDLKTKEPIFEKDLTSNRNKLYLAVPFTLKAKVKEPLLNKIVLKSENTNDYSRDTNRLNYPILGVDVGEYGLAWFLVKFIFNFINNNISIRDIKVFGRGFIEDNNIGKIKDYFAKIQQKSRLGAYDEDDTTIAKIRENAIGKLRNVIHSVITGNPEGASPIYEESISNFETGSGKTTKIYNSVKRADAEFESEADKAEHYLIWGKNTRYIGRNISAYASSYLCLNCLKSIYQIKEKDCANIKLDTQEGNILTFTTPLGKAKAYLKNKKEFNDGKTFSESEKRLKLLTKIFKDFARPPLKNSEVIKKFVLDKNILTQEELEIFRKKRGNSAIFVCPFCQFIADADIQAAFMMAMRGFLRFSGVVPSKSDDKLKEQEKTGDTFVNKTIEYLNELEPEVKQKIVNLVKI